MTNPGFGWICDILGPWAAGQVCLLVPVEVYP